MHSASCTRQAWRATKAGQGSKLQLHAAASRWQRAWCQHLCSELLEKPAYRKQAMAVAWQMLKQCMDFGP